MSTFVDFAVNLGVEIAKDKITDVSVEKQVRQQLTEYLEKQKKLNESIGLEEEIDFEELYQYITQNMMDDIKKRFWGEKHERRQARETIIQKACSFASSNTKLSIKRVMKIVSDVTDILSNYYRNKTNKELLFVKGEIEDTVIEQGEETRRLVKEETKQLKEVITSETTMSIDKSFGLIDKGQIIQVGKQVGDYLNGISAKHVLFPYYGFRMNTDNKMISFPLSDNAREKYPENYKLTLSSARLGNQPIGPFNNNTLRQSYRHQLPIHIDIKMAQKYLGNILDPIQSEANEMIGAKAVLIPPEFPKAFPCSVIVGEDIMVPYLLLRTKEILDDGTVIVTNEEQSNYHFKVFVMLDFNNKTSSFTITPEKPSNKEYLKYRMFLKRALSGEQVTVNLLQMNIKFLQGFLDQRNTDTLDSEIEFFSRIVTIEEYFNTSINIPEKITRDDCVLVDQIYQIICGQYVGNWKKHDLKLILGEETSKRINEMKDESYALLISGDVSFSIFDADLSLPIQREIVGARVEGLDRLKQKLTLFDVGDEVKISFIPSDDQVEGIYIDRIKSDDVEMGKLYTRPLFSDQ